MPLDILEFRAPKDATSRFIDPSVRRRPAIRGEIPGPLNAVTLLVSALSWAFIIASVWAISYLATFL